MASVIRISCKLKVFGVANARILGLCTILYNVQAYGDSFGFCIRRYGSELSEYANAPYCWK